MLPLTEMEIFYWIVRLGSLSQTADQLQVSKSFISKRLAKLEQQLAAKLVTRSTRQLTPTEAGRQFYQYCAKVVNSGQQAQATLSQLQDTASGWLKISAPTAFTTYLLADLIYRFNRQYPAIKLTINLENQLVSLVSEGYDLIIRSAKLADSDFKMQKLTGFDQLLCASPAYLTKHAIPDTPVALSNHQICAYSGKQSKIISLSRHNKEQKVKLTHYFESSHLQLVKAMVMQGAGIGLLPYFMVQNEIKQRKLVVCLANYRLSQGKLFLLYPDRDFMPSKTRLFIEAIKSFINTPKVQASLYQQ
jgi:DNA-binding transcriptional LysR family regulator